MDRAQEDAIALGVSQTAFERYSPGTKRWLRLGILFGRTGYKKRSVEGLVRTLTTVSRVSEAEVREVLGLSKGTSIDRFFRNLKRRADRAEGRNVADPMGAALAEITKELYAAHRRNRDGTPSSPGPGPLTHLEMLERLREQSAGVPIERVAALTINFDSAFLQNARHGLSCVPELKYAEQVADLGRLVEEVHGRGNGAIEVIPFYCLDPQTQGNLLAELQANVGSGKPFRGVKLYPPMGFDPEDVPFEVYRYCQQHGIPVISHASRRGAGARGRDLKDWKHAHPSRWTATLQRLERDWEVTQLGMFKLNLAHFADLHDLDDEWLQALLSAMSTFQGAKGVKVYSDVSNDVLVPSNKRRRYLDNATYVRRRGLAGQVLFGTDWWNNLPDSKDELFYLTTMGYGSANAPFDADQCDRNADEFLALA